MARNPNWETLKPGVYAKLDSDYPYYRQNTTVQNFPRKCQNRDLLQMRGQQLDYSCSLEMAHLALKISGLAGISEQEIMQAIKLSPEGSDPWDLFDGLCSLGVDCIAREGGTTNELVSKLNISPEKLYIWNGQQPAYSTKKEILETQAGHYMAACCSDETFIYFADPGYPNGKTRIKQEYLDLLWHDIQLATGRMIYGFMIEIPMKLGSWN